MATERDGFHAGFCALLLLLLPVSALAAQRDSELVARYNRAFALYLRGDFKSASRTLDQVIINPALPLPASVATLNAKLLSLRGAIASEQAEHEGDLAQAEAFVAWALWSDRDEAEYWSQYVQIRLRRQGYQLFSVQLRERESLLYEFPNASGGPRLQIPPDPRDWDILDGLELAVVGRDQDALEVFRRARLAPGAGGFFGAGQPTRRSVGTADCALLQAWGMAEIRANNLLEARRALTSIPQSCRNRLGAPFHYYLGLIDSKQGDASEARERFAEAIRLDEWHSAARAELALLDWDLNQEPERVRAAFVQTLKRDPSNWLTWSAFWQTNALMQPDFVKDYQSLAQTQAKSFPTQAAPQAAAALVFAWQGQFENAKAAARKTVALDPTLKSAWLAQMALSIATYDAAMLQSSMTALNRLDERNAERLRSAGIPSFLQWLSSNAGATRDEQQGSNALLGMAREFVGEPFVQAVAVRFLGSAAPRTVMNALVLDRFVFGRTLEEVQYQVRLQAEDIRTLSDSGRALLARIANLEIDARNTARVVQLHGRQIEALENTVTAVQSSLSAAELRLAELIQSRKNNVTEILDSLAMMLANPGDRELLPLGSQLRDWRTSPGRDVARSLIRLSKIISVGPSFGPVHINVLALLESVVQALK